ncbi:ABC transporter ATP-binding protein [Actinomadura sp. LOL_016]|uniref:ABC transporter ATP-binding protein n=1 Tax=unclassified Actinomadura TaxID=2626254 RepID=UPI003A7FC837
MTSTEVTATTVDGVDSPALALHDVRAGYADTTVLHGVSLVVPRGAVVALLGANGAGKSTLLRTVGGLNRVQSGRIELLGEDVGALAAHRRARRGLCYIPEGRAIFRGLSVRENLRLQADPGDSANAVERAVEAFPALSNRLDQTSGTLSGGQQQMLAMAQALHRDPALVMVDEASLGLAPVIVDEVFAFLETLAARGVALLIVDQFAQKVLQIATHAYVLRRGEIGYDGSPAELLKGDVFDSYIGPG